jgi:hypothetical protein
MEAEEIEMWSTNKKAIKEYKKVLAAVSSGRASSGICDVLSVNSTTGKKQLLKAIVTKGWVAQALERVVEDLLMGKGIHIELLPGAVVDEGNAPESSEIWEEFSEATTSN